MYMRLIVPAVLALGLFGSQTQLAGAQQISVCGPYAQVNNQLKQKYNERPTAYGLVEEKSIMQLYASSESGTWTIVMTDRRGMSCIVAAGHSLEQIDSNLTGPGA